MPEVDATATTSEKPDRGVVENRFKPVTISRRSAEQLSTAWAGNFELKCCEQYFVLEAIAVSSSLSTTREASKSSFYSRSV